MRRSKTPLLELIINLLGRTSKLLTAAGTSLAPCVSFCGCPSWGEVGSTCTLVDEFCDKKKGRLQEYSEKALHLFS